MRSDHAPTLGSLAGLVLTVATMFLPIYTFESGSIQFSHALFQLAVLFIIPLFGVKLALWSALVVLLAIYALCVELAASALYGNADSVIHGLYIVYNAVLAISVYSFTMAWGAKAFRTGLLLSFALAFTFMVLQGVDLYEMGDAGRTTGSFNNPNQLGYYSVCLISFAYLLYRANLLSYWMAALLYLGAFGMSVISLSKAALVANLIVLFLVFKPSHQSRLGILAWTAGFLAAAVAVYRSVGAGRLDDFLFFERLMRMTSEGDSSLAARGYFQFLEGNFFEILLGHGTERINSAIGHEVHSTFGAIVSSYGLLGLVIFMAFYILWAKTVFRAFGLLATICVVLPPTLYGITHNGIRFSIFWLLIAVSFALADRALLEARRRRGGPVAARPASGMALEPAAVRRGIGF